jgi:hypothetical protein
MKFFKNTLIPFVLLLCGLYLVPISIFELDFSKIPGDFGDARFNNYILEHGFQYLIGNVSSYWDAPFMYPYKNSISFSDNLLGTMPIYSIYRLLDFSRETAFQLWLVTLFILNYVCTYWVLKKWSDHIILSTVGAYIFSFSILLVGNIYNVQTMPRFIVPFLFYWTWLYLKEKNIINLYKLGFGLVFQFYCGIYLGFFTFYVLMFLTLGYFLISKDKAFFLQFLQKTTILKTVFAILFPSVLLLPLMLPYFENSKIIGMRSFEEVVDTIPTIQSYFFTSKEPMLWQFLSEHGTKIKLFWCHFLFIGALPWLAVIISPIVLFSKEVSKSKKQIILTLIVGLFLSMFFSMNFNSWTPYKLIYQLPGFSSMRSINRVINTEVLFFILLLVFVFKELLSIKKWVKQFILVLPILVVFDNLIYPQNIMRFDKQESINEINSVKKSIIQQNTKHLPVIVYLPLKNIGGQNIGIHLNVMLASQELGLSCVNAYTGSTPKGYDGFWKKMDDFTYRQWLEINHINPQNVQIINDLDVKEHYRVKISIQSVETNKFICFDQSTDNQVVVDREKPYDWETFTLVSVEDSLVLIVSSNSKLLSYDSKNDRVLSVDSIRNNKSTFFQMITIGRDTVVFKAQNNKYLSIKNHSIYIDASENQISSSEKFIIVK